MLNRRSINFKQHKDRQAKIDFNKDKVELDKYKYNMFLTVKHDILKIVKDQLLDKRVAFLRMQKLCWTFIVFR